MNTVLITGASTGIGRATTERLARAGATVFAGARSQADLDSLRAIAPSVVPVALEVTDPTSIAAARAIVEARVGTRLDAVVNNAGIVVAGPLEIVDPADFRQQFEVNVVGPLLITQAFLPHLRAARGRLVTVGSISGRFATPFTGAYSASKHAIEAFSDALRLEVAPFGVRVILIEPGPVKTPIWERTQSASRAAVDRADPARVAPYLAAIDRLQALSVKLEAGGDAPDVVARVIERALAAKRPRARYLVGSNAKVQAVLRNLPDGLRDRLIRSLFGI